MTITIQIIPHCAQNRKYRVGNSSQLNMQVNNIFLVEEPRKGNYTFFLFFFLHKIETMLTT